ncbi:hypothetical protein GF412_00130 [Candidatus Micrarchaeota archaeon]|nr:hypothetical protein [Candidatus Micrarchaeota archaeon]MBD3417382.1 hypothetical protein [Candidatus Micrarchaeota archaeon]
MENAKHGKRGGTGWGRLTLALIALMLFFCSTAYASFGEEFDYGGASGEEKFEEVFYSEEEGGTGQSQFINEAWEDYNPWGWSHICIFAIVISILIHTVVYILGKAISSRSIQRYALTEMMQAAASAVMIVALVGLIVGAFDFISSSFGGTVACMGETISDPVSGDMCRTQELLDLMLEQYNYAYEASRAPEMLYGLMISVFGVPIYSGSAGLVGTGVGGIYEEVETYHYIAHVCVQLMLFLSAKMVMLIYIQENMLQFFLPLGLVLRTFHFTRGIGAFFISLAIAMYFIYPTIAFVMDSSYASSEAQTAPQLPEIVGVGMCNIPMFGSFSFGSAAMEKMWNSGERTKSLSLSKDLATFLSRVYTHLFYSNMVAFAIALTFMRFSVSILGGDLAPFMGMVGRLV